MKLPKTPITYRQDIHGLRAWAVIAVLLFHFKIPGASAGFIGVDIFFVISGFLMTAIVVKGLESNSFSIWQFYLARIRRIVPALMALLVVLLVLGWFWLPTPDYQSLGAQSAYSLGFLSNIHFWRSAGYFDTAAQEKWLLHTWSLGIEFQFYVLFPLFVMLLWKIRPQLKTIVWGLGLACFASLALSIVASGWKPTAAFYLLPTRGWELVAGGLAFIIGREVPSLQRYSKPMFWFGFALWIVAAFLIDSSFAWPSGWALLPVLGTVLIIIAQHTDSKVMSNPLATWLGDRSYSLYLWHWPLVVALYFADLHNDWLWVASAFALSLVLGHVSYRWIETPTRIYLTAASVTKQVLVLSGVGALVGFAAVGVRLFVFEGRLPSSIEAVANEVKNNYSFTQQCIGVSDRTNNPVDCYFDKEKADVILIGDSHSSATFTALGVAAEGYNLSALHWAKSACPTLKGAEFQGRSPGCFEFNENIFLRLVSEFNGHPLILMSRLTRALIGGNEDEMSLQGKPHIYFTEEIEDGFNPVFQAQFKASLIETSCMLAEQRPVYLVRPIPEMGVDVPKTLARNILFGRGSDDVKITLDEYHQRHKFVWDAQDQAAEQCGVKILNPLPYLCDDTYCYGSRDGRPLYYDDDHLSEYGNKFLVPMFEQVFKDQGR